MGLGTKIWDDPVTCLRKTQAESSVLFFAPTRLQAAARRFVAGFPGLVTYAVKANPSEEVILNLAAAGVKAFDVASVPEIAMVRRLVPDAALHFNNPVRTRAEIDAAIRLGVVSFSVDSMSELDKLIAARPAPGTEVSVRFKLPVAGAIYDFGAKFGLPADAAAPVLARVAAAGLVPSLTFHPGTQCTEPGAWAAYIRAAAAIAVTAGVRIARLNVGGGFPSHRNAAVVPELAAMFIAIATETVEAFGDAPPALLCEPGRALVGDAFALAVRVRAVRDGAHVFLNDGIYGGLAEAALLGAPDRIVALAPDGTRRTGNRVERIVFGPTCDSVDRLPGMIGLPDDLAEGDWVVFQGMGAYCAVTATRFNGFGAIEEATVLALEAA
mgnify:FL=1